MNQQREPIAITARELGIWGECYAERYLRSCGYTVLARNWRGHGGELDRVIFDPDRRAAVAVEVKTRRASSAGTVRTGTPEEAVTPRKMRKIRSLLIQWVKDSGASYEHLGIDVVGILVLNGQCSINHVKDAN